MVGFFLGVSKEEKTPWRTPTTKLVSPLCGGDLQTKILANDLTLP